MTLTEYLQNAVTELRTPVCKICTGHEDPKRGALADHVEAMLQAHPSCGVTHPGNGDFYVTCAICDWEEPGLDVFPCPSLRSVAQLVATATGIPAPEGTT